MRVLVAEYEYDPYGGITKVTNKTSNDIGDVNPIRYRGYYYDSDTGLYYLQSRYYDPGMGRFINGDTKLCASLGIIGNNVYAYCLNNPLNKVDYSGNKPGDLFNTIDAAAKDFAKCYNGASIYNNVEYGSYIYSTTITISRYEWQTTVTEFINFSLRKGLFIDYKVTCERVCVKTKVTKYSYVTPNKGSSDSVSLPKDKWMDKKRKKQKFIHMQHII